MNKLASNFLSSCDMFKTTITLRTRLTPSYRPGAHQVYGSIQGAFLTFILIIMTLFYLGFLYDEMYSFQKDTYTTQGLVNDFQAVNEFKLHKENFLPSLEMRLSNDKNKFRQVLLDNPEIDIFSSK